MSKLQIGLVLGLVALFCWLIAGHLTAILNASVRLSLGVQVVVVVVALSTAGFAMFVVRGKTGKHLPTDVSPTPARCLNVYYCSDHSLFLEFGRLHEGLIVTEKEMIIHPDANRHVHPKILIAQTHTPT